MIEHGELFNRLEQRGQDTGRADDAAATVRHRIEEYEQKTLPLLDYYADRDILIHLDAAGPVDDVTTRIATALDERLSRA